MIRPGFASIFMQIRRCLTDPSLTTIGKNDSEPARPPPTAVAIQFKKLPKQRVLRVDYPDFVG
jgi:hypothetical protein